ncbi:phenylacetate--CoA ligase family protein [Oceanidesulfovibrio indonesiensis]|uniref:Phenylacetate--CoA ligase family protein n=2 Tax=Oceanidesulfovibrio indonesiensis TaxID=54767 RepID=A0A7M3MC54_9BACT|nr:phenylacetate--CoA ligase family protein [Oceanidesulfovibrio indonesiensis]
MAHGWSESAEVRERMEASGLVPGDLQSPEDYAKLPPLSKKQLIILQQDKGIAHLLAVDPGALSRIYMSPGPIFDPEGREQDYWGWTAAFHAAGFRAGDLVQMTFGYHLTPAGLMLEEPLREIGCAVVPAGPGNTDVQIDLMTRLPVTGFVGMASYLKVIKDKAVSKGLDPRKDFRLDVAFVAAERLPESLRQELEDAFGMRVRQGYGTADLGCAAYECRELTGMHVSPRCWVEICDPDTGQPVPPGEVGEVVVTPFIRAYPLLRLATGDLSRIVDEQCPCGRTSPRLAGILGRADDTTKVRGQFLYPHQIQEVVARFEQVARWQLVVGNQGGRETVLMRLYMPEGEVDQAEFLARFQALCKLRPAVAIVRDSEALPADAPRVRDERTY